MPAKRPRKRHGIGQVYGETHGSAKLTDKIVIALRELARSKATYGFMRRAASKYNVSLTTIHMAIKGKSWSHLPAPVTKYFGGGGLTKGTFRKECRKGHPMSGRNLHVYVDAEGVTRHACRACRNARFRKWYHGTDWP